VKADKMLLVSFTFQLLGQVSLRED